MRGLRSTGAAAMLVALTLSASGCAKVAQSLKPEPKVVVIAAKTASVEATLAGITMAPGRPSDLPLWPGSTVESSTQAQTPQGKSWTTSFTTPDDYEAVVKGFAVALKKAGWTSEVSDVSVGTEKTSLLSATGSDADALFTIARSSESSLTMIDVVVTPK